MALSTFFSIDDILTEDQKVTAEFLTEGYNLDSLDTWTITFTSNLPTTTASDRNENENGDRESAPNRDKVIFPTPNPKFPKIQSHPNSEFPYLTSSPGMIGFLGSKIRIFLNLAELNSSKNFLEADAPKNPNLKFSLGPIPFRQARAGFNRYRQGNKDGHPLVAMRGPAQAKNRKNRNPQILL